MIWGVGLSTLNKRVNVHLHPTLLLPQEVDLAKDGLCYPDGTQPKLSHGARLPELRQSS